MSRGDKTVTCKQRCRNEFQIKNLGLSYHSPERFVEPGTFCSMPLFWVIFEAVATLFYVTLVFYGLGATSFNPQWLTLLSNWSLLITTAGALVHFIAITTHYGVQRFIKPKPLRYSKMPLLFKVDWVLHNVRFSFTLIVTILRWSVEFEVQETLVVDVTLKGLALAYTILHMIIWRIPTRLLHFYQPMIVGAGYAIFSGVYWSLGGIYPNGRRYDLSIVDFDANLQLAIGVLLVFVFAVLFLGFLVGVFISHLIGWFRTFCLPHKPIYMKGVDYSGTDENQDRIIYSYNADDAVVYPSTTTTYYS